ncbi:MAG: glucose-1-phosphate cytidylyltransferase [Chloroflexi bacterium]|nr:MAG: glucose-1-phosphate cytidylyltransferase [Chloroflexota bacterium]
MPVVIVCGGPGTRMTRSTPTKKELVEIGERPILWHVMKIYAAYGHTRFILPLGHQAEALKRYFLEYKPMSSDFTVRVGQASAVSYHQVNAEDDWEITLVDTGLHTKKGTRIYRVARYIDSDTFFVTYGDGVGDVDIDCLLAFHREHGRLATVTGVHPRSQYGILQADETGLVTGFVQKPQLPHWINAGFMVFEREVLTYLSDGDNVHLERETLPRLASEGQLMMYRHTGFWRSMDTFKEALELDATWHESAPWKVW